MPHAHSGSAFHVEPREWFRGFEHLPRLIFTHKNPSLVLHDPAKICEFGFPHVTALCGYFKPTKRSKGKR
jgi:hypothetical protein